MAVRRGLKAARGPRSVSRDRPIEIGRYDYANQFGVPPSNEATSSRKLRGTFSTSKIKLFRLEKILGVAKIQNLKTHFCPPPLRSRLSIYLSNK